MAVTLARGGGWLLACASIENESVVIIVAYQPRIGHKAVCHNVARVYASAALAYWLFDWAALGRL